MAALGSPVEGTRECRVCGGTGRGVGPTGLAPSIHLGCFVPRKLCRVEFDVATRSATAERAPVSPGGSPPAGMARRRCWFRNGFAETDNGIQIAKTVFGDVDGPLATMR